MEQTVHTHIIEINGITGIGATFIIRIFDVFTHVFP